MDILASDPNSEVVLFSTPRNALEARFSVRYNAAAVLLQGDLSEESFSDSQVSSPQIQEIMRKVFVNERPANEFKNSMSGSMPVKVSLNNGTIYERSTMPIEIEGSSINPLPPDRLQKKFRSNATRRLSPELVEKAVPCWTDLRSIEDISAAVKSVCC